MFTVVEYRTSSQAYPVYARAILGLHEEGLAAARGDRDPERGRVRVAAVSTRGTACCRPRSPRSSPTIPPSTSVWR